MTHLPEMTDLLESWMNLFPTSSFMKGLLGLGVWDDEGATDFPFLVLDLLIILEILVKMEGFR